MTRRTVFASLMTAFISLAPACDKDNDNLPDLVTSWDQLTLFSDLAGGTAAAKDATHVYGPYMQSVPKNPLVATADASVVANEAFIVPAAFANGSKSCAPAPDSSNSFDAARSIRTASPLSRIALLNASDGFSFACAASATTASTAPAHITRLTRMKVSFTQ